MNDVIIRKITKSDKDAYFELADLFYHSPAVLHPVPKKNIENTWNELMRSNEYLECFFAVKGDEPIGFMLLAYTFSQESGGRSCGSKKFSFASSTEIAARESCFSNILMNKSCPPFPASALKSNPTTTAPKRFIHPSALPPCRMNRW